MKLYRKLLSEIDNAGDSNKQIIVFVKKRILAREICFAINDLSETH